MPYLTEASFTACVPESTSHEQVEVAGHGLRVDRTSVDKL